MKNFNKLLILILSICNVNSMETVLTKDTSNQEINKTISNTELIMQNTTTDTVNKLVKQNENKIKQVSTNKFVVIGHATIENSNKNDNSNRAILNIYKINNNNQDNTINLCNKIIDNIQNAEQTKKIQSLEVSALEIENCKMIQNKIKQYSYQLYHMQKDMDNYLTNFYSNNQRAKIDFSQTFNNIGKTIIDEKNKIILDDIERNMTNLTKMQQKYNYYYNAIKFVISSANMCFYITGLLYKYKDKLINKEPIYKESNNTINLLKLAYNLFILFPPITTLYYKVEDRLSDYIKYNNALRKRKLSHINSYNEDIIPQIKQQLIRNNSSYFEMFDTKLHNLKKECENYRIMKERIPGYLSQCDKQIRNLLKNHYYNQLQEYKDKETYSIDNIIDINLYYIERLAYEIFNPAKYCYKLLERHNY